jgi:hypothetical protein
MNSGYDAIATMAARRATAASARPQRASCTSR